ncbi:hypothetical protein HID58_037767 [Brassica napus]|uniref:Uncharacterized protein n=1 Tax=Brassica napus TaxID=3708 RepID=A0ABQ8BMC2_BRANA|nr:hypothetical protein HID58_037767 [Brassica napus]
MLRRRRITDLQGQILQSRDFNSYCPHIVIDVSMSLNKQIVKDRTMGTEAVEGSLQFKYINTLKLQGHQVRETNGLRHIHKNSMSFKFQSHEGVAGIKTTPQWNIRLHKNQETVTVNPETKRKHTIRHSKVFVDTLEHSGDESSLFRLRNSQRRAKA